MMSVGLCDWFAHLDSHPISPFFFFFLSSISRHQFLPFFLLWHPSPSQFQMPLCRLTSPRTCSLHVLGRRRPTLRALGR